MKDPTSVGPLTWGEILFGLTVAWLLCVLAGLGCATPEPEQFGTIAVPGMAMAACDAVPVAEPTPAAVAQPAEPAQRRGLWIVGLPVAETVAGCRQWAEFGLTCEAADSPGAAALRLVAEDATDCPVTDTGIAWLGSGQDGHVSIRLACFRGAVGSDDGITSYYEATIAHEIGHALGLQHVDQAADAVMRPLNPRRGSISDADRMEFLRVWGTGSPP